MNGERAAESDAIECVRDADKRAKAIAATGEGVRLSEAAHPDR